MLIMRKFYHKGYFYIKTNKISEVTKYVSSAGILNILYFKQMPSSNFYLLPNITFENIIELYRSNGVDNKHESLSCL